MTKKRTKRITQRNQKIGAALILIGTVFKLQHWPYSKIILIFGIILGGISLLYEKFIMKD
ncbi:hypothetical protein PI23P_06031 [Polaribacter irgensii 23-P]|jgi:hypothetical protein|uniref:Gliding motility protein GldL-like N-terminal domain-containing protein n=1 Tax=Polaribacter irgensii 23-P TaxID=313594 RepID=A4C305_9FLAO|nr:hypothetical protein [Polaribacter irgensii]EAR11476.1 hypothetical protein PI23P_06031 [Polaribacter irgensii 23-P]